jgi:hypothetical protein
MGNIFESIGNNIKNKFCSETKLSSTSKSKFILKDEYPDSKYYSNTYLREWIAENKIHLQFHKWLPLGINYTVDCYYTKGELFGDVKHVYSCFKRTNLSLYHHLANIHIFDDNCYILLSKRQQQLLELNKIEDSSTGDQCVLNIGDYMLCDEESNNESDQKKSNNINLV